MLGVSPNTLRSWERRFGYPSPARTSGGHRQYALADVEALKPRSRRRRTSPPRSRSRASAAPGRRPRTASGSRSRASRRTRPRACSRRASRSARSSAPFRRCCCRPSPSCEAEDPASPEHSFAWRFATDWLSALRRVAPPATRERRACCCYDATAPGDLDALRVQALELLLRRAGLRTLTLTAATEPARLGRALRALRPDALVLGGTRASLDAIGRLVYAVRSGARGDRGARLRRRAAGHRREHRAPARRRAARRARRAAGAARGAAAPAAPRRSLPGDGEIVVARRHTAALPF